MSAFIMRLLSAHLGAEGSSVADRAFEVACQHAANRAAAAELEAAAGVPVGARPAGPCAGPSQGDPPVVHGEIEVLDE